jgi:hypothetical protein
LRLSRRFNVSSAGAVIQISISSAVVGMAGIALRWMISTSLFGPVVKDALRLRLSLSMEGDGG